MCGVTFQRVSLIHLVGSIGKENTHAVWVTGMSVSHLVLLNSNAFQGDL